jgi:SAM-dependent methyltransferase
MRKPGASDFQAQIGVTHHLGGQAATEELIGLSGLQGGERVLEVGCGAGITTVMLAVHWHCQVHALDCSERMVARTRQILTRAKSLHRARTRRGEIKDLPYASDYFDFVFGESVTACVRDRSRAMREYLRVLQPGGILALNEPTWVRTGPPVHVLDWVHADRDLAGALTAAAWATLLADAGFALELVALRKTNRRNERRQLLRRYRLPGMLVAAFRRLGLWIRSREYRGFARAMRAVGPPPPDLFDYLGYGLFICRKPV